MGTRWKKINETVIHSGFRNVLKRTFELPDGRTAAFEIHAGHDIAWIFALTPDERVILVRQFRPGPEDFMLEIPAGGIEAGEDPLRGAQRELLEETGFEGDFTLLAQSPAGAYNTARSFHFLATNCRKVAEPEPDEFEFIETVFFSLDDLRAALRSGGVGGVTAWLALKHLNKW